MMDGAPPGVQAPRVLIVEDDDSIAAALDFVLTRGGMDHDRIADGAEALPRIRATRPDLVLLDVMLPGASGFDICEGVRADPDLAGVRILLMTARGSALERKRGAVLGADGFITKPFDLGHLRAEVARLLATPR